MLIQHIQGWDSGFNCTNIGSVDRGVFVKNLLCCVIPAPNDPVFHIQGFRKRNVVLHCHTFLLNLEDSRPML
jgi:hypothetical protein